MNRVDERWTVLPYPWEIRGLFILVRPPDLEGQHIRSITNAADEIIDWLARRGLLQTPPGPEPQRPRRVLYEDSEGVWDELVHDGRRLVHFGFLGGRTAEEALELAEAPR